MIILAVFFFSLNDQGNNEGFFAAMLVDILILTFKTENVFGWFEGSRGCLRSDHHHQAQSVRAHDDYYKIKSAG